MRTSDLDILIVPGWTNSGPDHWQSRWQAQLKTARRVEFASWDKPVLADWVARLAAEVETATRPVLLLAHSLGVLAVAHAAPRLAADKVAGAFLVAPPDFASAPMPSGIDSAFAPAPTARLPFRSVLVHSATDPYCPPAAAVTLAAFWGSEPADAGDSGHINSASGHGPWPEGLLRLATFLRHLG
ncbi:MAG: alpha/beta hydrolase [Hyphomicrobiales bacterium]|nr:MAG: alpha/beta hydrolase [Hyphomicrobiales bacterium]